MLTLSADGTSDQDFLHGYAERFRFSSFEVVLVGFFPDALGYSSMGKNSGR
jgi:hypothetical protein